ncbi:TRAP-type C4-dicarboxylate transport system, substrate-binding protein [Bradyrhizobium sp. Rc2d]|uniref:TRAP transporter substrate-binding protein DctP n=1 Tax=Bradyrhizobium sp. Rc2d TaxID=1855321 RepID=UPI0008843B19|nr:TRAP transporter substrate-binding protein DctP [Bradyrhizobium sp. Rc2d]SDH89122.1 TRAP-type C4-dicarboxylate transport system, substrate-binding protein [Bradyrhizobium sp. Rc2d]
MQKLLAFLAIISLSLLPSSLIAEPIKLKVAFYSSDQSMSFLGAVKPFTDAVGSAANGAIQFEFFFSGALGKDVTMQPQIVRDGAADIAFAVPGVSPDLFPDNAVLELPGLFRDSREATLVYTRLIAQNMLRGYDDFYVIAACVTEPETIHSHVPIKSLADLSGKRIRINNPREGAVLEKLGAIPVLMPITKITEAISSGKLDAAMVNPTPLSDYGIKRVTPYHYFLRTSGAPLLTLMNRKRFEALPNQTQDIIRAYSEEWPAERFIATYDAGDEAVMRQLKSDPKRTLVFPSVADREKAQHIFDLVIDDWASSSERNRELLRTVKAELVKLRQEQGRSDPDGSRARQ